MLLLGSDGGMLPCCNNAYGVVWLLPLGRIVNVLSLRRWAGTVKRVV